jgi:hypothetical protein
MVGWRKRFGRGELGLYVWEQPIMTKVPKQPFERSKESEKERLMAGTIRLKARECP